MEDIILPYIYAQVNQHNEGVENRDGVRVPPHHYQKDVPLLSFIPIKNSVIRMLHVILVLGDDLLDYFWKSWLDECVDELTPQDNTARMMTMMSNFQVTQVEERHETLQSNMK